MSIAVDVREFQGALKDYLRATSKDLVTALNGKAKDLALRAAQHTPKSKMTYPQFRKQQADPEFITARAKIIFDRRGGAGGGRQFSEIRRATEAAMAAKKFQRGYMRSGFVKAATAFKVVKDASKAPRMTLEGKFDNTHATTKTATAKSLAAVFDVTWAAKGGNDQSQKQAIVTRPMGKAIQIVTADMRIYLERKMEKNAKAITATTGRAILKAFR